MRTTGKKNVISTHFLFRLSDFLEFIRGKDLSVIHKFFTYPMAMSFTLW